LDPETSKMKKLTVRTNLIVESLHID